MNRFKHYFGMGLLAGGLLWAAGCSTQQHKQELLPSHDEVLIYRLAYDLAYLRTVEAVENIPGWELQETEKEKGIIRLYNHQFSRFDDPDRRVATLLVKRVNRDETSIEFAPQSKRVAGGKEIFQVIAQYLSRELGL